MYGYLRMHAELRNQQVVVTLPPKTGPLGSEPGILRGVGGYCEEARKLGADSPDTHGSRDSPTKVEVCRTYGISE